MCPRWSKKLESCDFDLNNKPRSGRPSLTDDKQDPSLTTPEIVEKLHSKEETISDHIRKLELAYKYSRLMPHELSETNIHDQLVVCISLFARNKNKREQTRFCSH